MPGEEPIKEKDRKVLVLKSGELNAALIVTKIKDYLR